MNQVTFSISNSTIFNNCRIISAYQAKELRDKNGESQLNKFEVTQDDKPMFDMKLKEASIELFRIMRIYSASMSNDSDITYVLSMPDDFDVRTLPVIESNISKVLISYVLREFYLLNSLSDLAALYNEKFTDGLESVKSQLNEKVGTIERHINYF